MPLKPCSHCLCFKIYIGSKLISVIEILRVCIIGFILIIEAVTSGVSLILFHYIFRTFQTVTLMFAYLSVHAVRVFTCLNNREPNWTTLQVYYKLKFSVTLIWTCEISVITILIHTIYPTTSMTLATIILSYIGCLFDFYFSYSIYSCMKLGQLGFLSVQPVSIPMQNLGTQSNEDVYVAREFKEVIAYPVQPSLPECEFVVVYDYTKGKSGN